MGFNNQSPNLDEFRLRIDELDNQILELLKQRSSLTKKVGDLKRLNAIKTPQYIRHEREADMLKKLIENNDSLLSSEDIGHIFREIISACRGLEGLIKVAYLGPQGTFSEMATINYFGHSNRIHRIAQKTIAQVFEEVEKSRCDLGVVPIENSFEGTVNQTLDALISSDSVQINAEISLVVKHHLASLCNHPNEVKRLFAHEQSLSQCRQWIDAHHADWQIQTVNSNGEAARLASTTPNCAAITSAEAIQQYQLNCLQKNIQTSTNNITRFLIIGRNQSKPSQYNKTSIIFSVKDQPGSLLSVLQEFKKQGINLTKLQSRPSRQNNWEYVFYAELEGYIDDEPIAQAIQAIAEHTLTMKVVGSYPQNVDLTG